MSSLHHLQPKSNKLPGKNPCYGGTFLSAGNEEIAFYDMHQTSLGGIFAAVSPAYNCLIRTSPYDPIAMDIIPELAHTWDVSDGGKTITFHLHKGVKWHDGTPFSGTQEDRLGDGRHGHE